MKKSALLTVCTSLFILFAVSPAKAEIDGNKLLTNCNEAVRYLEDKNGPAINLSAVNFCVGYITGVNELHRAFVRSVACFEPPVFCAPPPVDDEQLVQIVVQFLKKHPEDLHLQGSALTLAALKEAFPCADNTL